MPQLTNYILGGAQNSRFKQAKKKPNKKTLHKSGLTKHKPRNLRKCNLTLATTAHRLALFLRVFVLQKR